MGIRNDVSRESGRARHALTLISGCILIAVGLLSADLPQILQVSVISIGILNVLLGIAGLVPRNRVRVIRTLQAVAYLAFVAGLVIIVILAL